MRTVLVLMGVLSATARAQVFSVVPDPPTVVGEGAVAGPRPVAGSVVAVNLDGLGAALDGVPMQQLDLPLEAYGRAIQLPSPTGDLVRCFAARSTVMEEGLQERYPQIQTFIVQSVDKTATGRLEISPRGLTAMLRGPSGVWMIDPWRSADPGHAVAYWLRDLPGGGQWSCHTVVGAHGFGTPEVPGGDRAPFTLGTLRTVRLAMACTGEYGLYQCQIQGHAGNVVDPLAAIVTVVSRANVVYEADLGVHFNLVANNDQVVFFDPATDPYPTTCDGNGGADCSGNLLSVNINMMAARIGNANFDIGHVVTRIAGGVAYLSSVCGAQKAGGVSGIPRGGDIDPFSALVVIHEMGHQFGANHTFSGTRGRCAGNVNLPTAWEAGSGSSPMAYAGGCPVGDAPPSDNVAQFADPFFHHGSLGEMQTFLNAKTCPAQSATGNNVPAIVSTSPSSPIPPGTPFVLAASATDADAETLTYSWEEYDSGVARPLSGAGSADNGSGALFRAFPPTLSPQRTFPQTQDVLSGIAMPGEQLPTVTGTTRRFRVVVRDNHPGGGGVAISPFVDLTIQPGTSPFSVVAPSEGATLAPGENELAWTVGNTDLAPISCSTVTVLLSLDDGATFPLVLGTFSNSGAATLTLPPLRTSSSARLRVDADNCVFFAVSRPFTLQAACLADYDLNSFVNGSDLDAFVVDFESGSPRADVNGDNFVTAEDLDLFLERFVAGC